MALNWQVYLDDELVEEPTNMRDMAVSLVRDDLLHGIGFEASTTALNFIGDGATYIDNVKKTQGLKALIKIEVKTNCGGSAEVLDTVITGVLDLTQYKKVCGRTGCVVEVPIIADGCETLLNNLVDQQVNVDNRTAFDNITQLPNYAQMGINMQIPGKALQLIDSATESGNEPRVERMNDQFGFPGFSIGAAHYSGHITPASDTQQYAALGSFNPGSFLEYFPGGDANYPSNISYPITVNTETLIGTLKCKLSSVIVNFRFKGSIQQTTIGPSIATTSYTYKVFRLPAGLDRTVEANWQTLYSQLLCTLIDSQTGSFDIANTLEVPGFAQGDWIVISVFMDMVIPTLPNDAPTTIFRQDPVSFYTITANSICEPSNADVYFVHETLSRVVEAITNYCTRVKSSFYGRTDSEPFDFPEDGCGGLRILTSGLKIRNAANPVFTTSLKGLVTGLQAIDNIGMGVESDPDRDGFYLLRVEDLDFFYQDVEVLRHLAIPTGESDVVASLCYSLIQIGYKNWEITNTNGLDEFNSTREYRTSLTTLSNTLAQVCELIASGYVLEITRQQSFADTGAADTTYDNNNFIVCVKRVAGYGYGYSYSSPVFEVEQGNILDAQNMLDPSTVINFRISPVRNLMRWFRSIAASYANIVDSVNSLFFNSGTGNLKASGKIDEVVYGGCVLETDDLVENQTIGRTNFKSEVDATPLWSNETFTYSYPMSLADYFKLKANRYGYITIQCGNGDLEQGWIKQVDYTPALGMANIILKRKWQ